MAIVDALDIIQRQKINIGFRRTCQCPPTHINCMIPKEWLKSQIGVWQFYTNQGIYFINASARISMAFEPFQFARKLFAFNLNKLHRKGDMCP